MNETKELAPLPEDILFFTALSGALRNAETG